MWLLAAITLVLLLTAQESCTTETGGGGDEAGQVEEDEEAAEDTEDDEGEPPPPQSNPQPRPNTLRGSGSKVERIRLRADSLLVVAAQHSGSANFFVELVPRGGGPALLFNEIGGFRGQTLLAEALSGRYRVRVEADGSWRLRFSQPLPKGNEKAIPGTVKGRGAQVVPLQAHEDLQAIVTARHRGSANFIVEVVGYGDLSGTQLLFNEIGNFSGETIAEIPAGSFLLHVQADGAWRLKFEP